MNEIRIENTDKKAPFKRWCINRKNSIKFNDDPKFRIQGKDISIKDYQNKNAVDCNIYEVIEKYRGDLKMTAEQLNQFHTEIDESLANIKSMPDALMAIKAGEKAWKELPLEQRQIFGNSINRFLKDGPEYFKREIKKYNDLQAKPQAEQEITQKETIEKESK